MAIDTSELDPQATAETKNSKAKGKALASEETALTEEVAETTEETASTEEVATITEETASTGEVAETTEETAERLPVRPVKLTAAQHRIINPATGVMYRAGIPTPLLDFNAPEAHFERIQEQAGVLVIVEG